MVDSKESIQVSMVVMSIISSIVSSNWRSESFGFGVNHLVLELAILVPSCDFVVVDVVVFVVDFFLILKNCTKKELVQNS